MLCVFFFKQKTAYEMRISDWSSDVCSSDLQARRGRWRRNGALTRKLALGLIPALLIGACTVGPDYHAPEIAVPPAYQEAPTVAAPGAQIDPAYWWKAFGDPELDALVARALADQIGRAHV